jgi:hypothetical protein
MPATVGSISIDLSTNAAKFASGFKSAATTVESQSARMAKSVAAVELGVNKIGGTLKTFLGGLAAGAGFSALTSLGGAFDKLKQTISDFDEIATNARTVGLRTDTYQALAFSAKQANISQESFNSSLSIFAKNAGLAEKGAGALFAGLKNLNPQLLQNILNTKDQEERLKLVSDALAQTSDATQKAALSAVVFGKGGVQMAQFLDQGRASIDAMKKSAQEMGIIIPDDLLQRAGKLDDQLDVLSTVINSQLSQALINLAPILTGATQGFADFSKEINASSAVIDNFINNPSLQNFGKIFGPGLIQDGFNKLAESSHRSTDEIQADIDEVTKRLADLKIEAAAGFEVGLATDRAQDELKALQEELRRTSIAAQAAANNQAGAIQGILDSMGQLGTKATQQLPTVTRYGGDPNKITLPDQSRTVQTNANGTGVNVTRYNPSPSGQYNSEGKPIVYIPPGMAEDDMPDNRYVDYVGDTADNTKSTADNINRLDQNSQRSFRGLTDAMGRYSSNEVNAIDGLDSSVSQQVDALSAITAQMVAEGLNSGNISKPSTMFGDQWDPQHGSHVGDVVTFGSHGGKLGKLGSYSLSSYADDGTSNTHVSVAQPGSDITLNYYAAPGESAETAKQRARDMFNELTLQASRA